MYQSINEQGNSNGIQSHPAEENYRRRRSEWTKPEVIIAGIGLLLSMILGYVTYQLFLKTIEANEISANALKEAKRANDETERTNRRNYIRDTINDRAQEEKDRFNMEIGRQSLQAQINSIKETQRQFTVSNMPFLEVTDCIIPIFQINKNPVVRFKIVNQGKMPAEIISGRFDEYFTNNRNQNIEKKIKNLGEKAYNGINGYVTQSFKEITYIRPAPMDDFTYNACMFRNWVMLLVGQIKYFNVVDGTKRVLEFGVYINPAAKNGYEMVYLKNKNT
jgi:hypothetical protein